MAFAGHGVPHSLPVPHGTGLRDSVQKSETVEAYLGQGDQAGSLFGL
jgi:hypothetical protein